LCDDRKSPTYASSGTSVVSLYSATWNGSPNFAAEKMNTLPRRSSWITFAPFAAAISICSVSAPFVLRYCSEVRPSP
jgi:hypothetical protein